MSAEETNKTQICKLPNEVLEMIFDRLAFRARLTSKLVCRRWCNILLAQKYRKYEKIVLRGFYPADEILNVLSQCDGGLQHLEFQNVHLDSEKFDSSFWITHGAQIDELRFRYCTTDPETFLGMAVHCVNLKSLYWDNHDGDLLCSSEALDFLIHINFTGKNLHVFETGSVSLHWLGKFRKVFPNVEYMSYFLNPQRCVRTEPFPNEKEIRKIRRINDRELNLPEISQKKLTLRFRNLSADFLRKALVSAYELQRLQEIVINADNMENLPKDEFLRIVSQQPVLEKIKFVGETGEMLNFGERLLEILFERCHKLRWLFLHLEKYDLKINAMLFSKMKSSQLSYLWLQCLKVRFDEVLYKNLSDDNSQKNSSLRHLGVYSTLESSGFHLLLRSFSRLDHLEMNWFSSNEVLKSIITYQSHLKSLRFITQKLTPSKQLDDESISYQFYHLEKLKNYTGATEIIDLKYLLMLFRGSLQKEKLAEFQLSNLEYLFVKVERGNHEFFEAWLNALSRSKKLRALHFCNSQVEISFESWLKFCSALRNLEYLCIAGTGENGKRHTQFTEEEFNMLFHASPSLRIIVQFPDKTRNPTQSYISAVYDRVKEEIININRKPSYTIRNSNLDYYYTDWMYF